MNHFDKKDSWRGCHKRCHKTMLSQRQCAWANARYYVIIIFMFYLLNLIRNKPIQLFDAVGPGIVCYLYIAHVTITMHHHNTNNWPDSVQPWRKYISIFIFFRCDLPVFEIKFNEEIKFNNALGSIEWPNIFTYINILNYLNCKLWFDFLGITKLMTFSKTFIFVLLVAFVVVVVVAVMLCDFESNSRYYEHLIAKL